MGFFKSHRQTNLTDAELIADYKTGNKEAMEIIFDRYAHLVYAICMKYFKDEEESRDAVLSIFEKVLLAARKYEIKNFGNWIYTVTRNYCYGKMQENKRLDWGQNIKSEEQAEWLSTEEEDSRLNLTYDESRLDKALAMLSEEQKRCVELFYLHQRCYQDIANETGYALNQVKSYIQNGKRNLKIYLLKK